MNKEDIREDVTPEENEGVTNEGEETTENENQEETLEELKERLAKAEKKASDFEKALKKYKSKLKEGNQVHTSEFVTKEDLFFERNQIFHDEDKSFVKAIANSRGIYLEEALSLPETKAVLEQRQQERKSAQMNQKMQNNNGGSIDESFLSDEEWKQAFIDGQIERTDENIAKFARITRKK